MSTIILQLIKALFILVLLLLMAGAGICGTVGFIPGMQLLWEVGNPVVLLLSLLGIAIAALLFKLMGKMMQKRPIENGQQQDHQQ